MESCTALAREQSAQKLDAAGRALARDRLLWGAQSAGGKFDAHMWRHAHEAVLGAERTAGGWSGPLEPAPERPRTAVGVEREGASGRPVSAPEVWDPESSRYVAKPVNWHGMGRLVPPLPGEERDELGNAVPWQVESKKAPRTRPVMNLRRSIRWHSSRAENKRSLFKRVRDCAETDGTRITLVCRGCKDRVTIEVGCGSTWFCAECRKRSVLKFRKNFERSRLGLVTAATRAGLTRRNQKKGERWSEKLLTVTLPHRGEAVQRVETLRDTWARFWRTLRDHQRPELQGPSGITIADVPRGFPRSFEDRDDPNELKMLDMLSYLHVFEWTPGSDGKGHPHMHVWLFSRFLDQKLLQRLWQAAHLHVLRKQREDGGWSGPLQEVELVVDIREAGPDVAHELVKYLTKDWEISESGAKRAAPEVFAQVYAALDGKRRRQSSAAFSMWAVEKFNACPCCGYERERGHWARIDIEHALEEAKVTDQLGTVGPPGLIWDPDTARYGPAPLVGAGDYELRAKYDAAKDLEWLDSFELRTVKARMRVALADPAEDWER